MSERTSIGRRGRTTSQWTASTIDAGACGRSRESSPVRPRCRIERVGLARASSTVPASEAAIAGRSSQRSSGSSRPISGREGRGSLPTTRRCGRGAYQWNGSGNDRLDARPPGALRAPWRRRPSIGASADDDPSSPSVPSIGSERPATPREHVAMASDHRLSGRAGPNSCGLRALERPDASSNLPVQPATRRGTRSPAPAVRVLPGERAVGVARRRPGMRAAIARCAASALRPVHPTTARTALGLRRTGACACRSPSRSNATSPAAAAGARGDRSSCRSPRPVAVSNRSRAQSGATRPELSPDRAPAAALPPPPTGGARATASHLLPLTGGAVRRSR